jgi:ACT domain-containing protein
MKLVITILGKDQVGIVAMVATACAEQNINILDINQNTLKGLFHMVMIADAAKAKVPLRELQDILKDKGEKMGLEIRAQHEDIFKIMHKV